MLNFSEVEMNEEDEDYTYSVIEEKELHKYANETTEQLFANAGAYAGLTLALEALHDTLLDRVWDKDVFDFVELLSEKLIVQRDNCHKIIEVKIEQ